MTKNEHSCNRAHYTTILVTGPRLKPHLAFPDLWQPCYIKPHDLNVCNLISGYIENIYNVLINTPRAELQELADELKAGIPPPLHSMLTEKESRADAEAKYLERKNKETPIVPPTCTGTVRCQLSLTLCVKSKLIIYRSSFQLMSFSSISNLLIGRVGAESTYV